MRDIIRFKPDLITYWLNGMYIVIPLAIVWFVYRYIKIEALKWFLIIIVVFVVLPVIFGYFLEEVKKSRE